MEQTYITIDLKSFYASVECDLVKHGAMINGAKIDLDSEPRKGTKIKLTF